MSRYLDMVDQPAHVKKLTLEQLTNLAEEIRQELITKLAKNGGHLGPNLGVVELTIALHAYFPRQGQIRLGRQPSELRPQDC